MDIIKELFGRALQPHGSVRRINKRTSKGVRFFTSRTKSDSIYYTSHIATKLTASHPHIMMSSLHIFSINLDNYRKRDQISSDTLKDIGKNLYSIDKANSTVIRLSSDQNITDILIKIGAKYDVELHKSRLTILKGGRYRQKDVERLTILIKELAEIINTYPDSGKNLITPKKRLEPASEFIQILCFAVLFPAFSALLLGISYLIGTLTA